MSPFAGIAGILLALTLLLGAVKRLQTRRMAGPELARKIVHMGMGVVCLPLPWIFSEVWPVWALAALAGMALAALRLVPSISRSLGSVLHGVQRLSYGELYFPLSVATVFTLANGNPLLYVVPIALLTFADAAGALIGKRFGRQRYQTLEGEKSIEGSLSVCLVALICVAVPLLFVDADVRQIVLIAALLALFATALEAISWQGLDNVFLPLAAYAQLNIYLHAPLNSLFVRLLVFTAFATLAMIWRRGHLVDDGARLGIVLSLYFFWTVGGWPWLVAPVILLASYVRLMPARPVGQPLHNLLAVICVGSVGVAWAVAYSFSPASHWLWLFTLGIATHQAVIATVRFSQRYPRWQRLAWGSIGISHAICTQGVALWLLDREHALSSAHLTIAALCVAGAVALFTFGERTLQMPADLNARWWAQGATAFLASTAGLFFLPQ